MSTPKIELLRESRAFWQITHDRTDSDAQKIQAKRVLDELENEINDLDNAHPLIPGAHHRAP